MIVDLPLLLDTCAIIWMARDQRLSTQALAALESALKTRQEVHISPISAWELGILASRGQLRGTTSARKLFDIACEKPGTNLAKLSPSVLHDSSFLPGDPPNDPADRIIIATAREYGLCVVTRDRRILDYADQGHVQALAC